jgi:hypothetical protein
VTTTVVAAGEPADVDEPGTGEGRLARLRRRCAVLFPEPPAGGRRAWWTVPLAIAAVIAGTCACLLRQGGTPAWDSVWAEDGVSSLSGAVRQSFWAALTTPVSGYYQTLPRLLAEPVALLPAAWAAKAFALEAAGVTALFALAVYVASGAHLRTPLARLVASAVAVVPPVGMVDVPNSLCNLHWPGMYALLWMLLWVPRGRIGKACAVAVVLVVALTNIMVLVFLPLAFVRFAFGPKGPHSRIVAAALPIGLLPQVYGMLTGMADGRTAQTHPGLLEPIHYYFGTALPFGLFGEVLGGALARHKHLILPMLAWLLVAAIIGVAALRITRPNWVVAAVLAAHSIVFWVVASGSTGLSVPRYLTTPAMFAVAALVALLLPQAERLRAGPLVGFAIILTVVWTASYRVPNARNHGPSWTASVARARAQCTGPGSRLVPIQIAPYDVRMWTVHLPCGYLRQ